MRNNNTAHKTHMRESQAKRYRFNGDPTIMFEEEEVEHLDSEYDNTLIISMQIVNASVKRILNDKELH